MLLLCYLSCFMSSLQLNWTCNDRDVHTSTFLAAFKSNASGRNALSLLGRDYLVAAQQPKGVLHFWAWHKARLWSRSAA